LLCHSAQRSRQTGRKQSIETGAGVRFEPALTPIPSNVWDVGTPKTEVSAPAIPYPVNNPRGLLIGVPICSGPTCPREPQMHRQPGVSARCPSPGGCLSPYSWLVV
jgi:hypothetical protein